LGELPVLDVIGSTLISWKDGSKVFSSGRMVLETFEIIKTFEVPDNVLQYRKFLTFQRLKEKFEVHEVSEVMRRIHNADDIVFAKKKEVANLKKLFKGLGKYVAVLPSLKVVDLGKDFTLYIRKDMEMIVTHDDDRRVTDVTMFEVVGFASDLT